MSPVPKPISFTSALGDDERIIAKSPQAAQQDPQDENKQDSGEWPEVPKPVKRFLSPAKQVRFSSLADDLRKVVSSHDPDCLLFNHLARLC